MFETEWVLGEANAHDALMVRRKVFMEELGLPQETVFDQYDEYAAHLVVRLEGKPIASGRLYFLEDAVAMDSVCVIKEYRGQRFFDLCVRVMMDRAQRINKHPLHVKTLTQYAPYFKAFGFLPAGQEAGGYLNMRVHPDHIIWHSTCKE